MSSCQRYNKANECRNLFHILTSSRCGLIYRTYMYWQSLLWRHELWFYLYPIKPGRWAAGFPIRHNKCDQPQVLSIEWGIIAWHAVYICEYRADSRFAPSQWETWLLCNDVSHWLGAILESALEYMHNADLMKCAFLTIPPDVDISTCTYLQLQYVS